jgi:F-type H+-transporting ATPase subunit b
MTVDWWTLGIQSVNIAILIWLLGRFFWRPVASMIEQRRTAALQMLAAAEAKQHEATAALAEIEHSRAGIAQEREAMLAAAREAAERDRTARLEDAARELSAMRAAAAAEIAKGREAEEQNWSDRASRLAVEIAAHLLAPLDGQAVRGDFLDRLIDQIGQLPEPARRANGVALEAVSAAPLDAAEQERCRTRIQEAFGSRPEVAFTADPTLIAGLELHGPHLVVSNSWRADLDRILKEIAHDSRP